MAVPTWRGTRRIIVGESGSGHEPREAGASLCELHARAGAGEFASAKPFDPGPTPLIGGARHVGASASDRCPTPLEFHGTWRKHASADLRHLGARWPRASWLLGAAKRRRLGRIVRPLLHGWRSAPTARGHDHCRLGGRWRMCHGRGSPSAGGRPRHRLEPLRRRTSLSRPERLHR